MKLVIHNAAKVWGGNEKWMLTLASGLVRRGWMTPGSGSTAPTLPPARYPPV